MIKRLGNIKSASQTINAKLKIYVTLYRRNKFNVSSQLLRLLARKSHNSGDILLSFYAHIEYHLPLEVVNNISDF